MNYQLLILTIKYQLKMNILLKKRWSKIACVAFAILSTVTVANAQKTAGDFSQNNPGALNGPVRVVDNKGTVKYLQTKNGITMLTNTSSSVTTTTWQLGGTLTDDTYINTAGNVFALDGIVQTSASQATAYTPAHGTGGSGYTFLVHNEATGAIEKLILPSLIVGGHDIFTVANPLTLIYACTGVTAGTFPTASYKVNVYRNGAKLIPTTDYSFDVDGKITLIPSAAANQDWALSIGDVIEVSWNK